MNLVAQAWFGGTVVMMRRWDPRLRSIERERVTGLSGVPAMAWDLVHSPSIGRRDMSSFRAWVEAARHAARSAADPKSLPGCGTGTGYGMTESSALTASIGGLDYVERPTSVGVPIPICDVRIVDDGGEDVSVGEVGESGSAARWWRRAVATAKRPKPPSAADGTLGDLGRRDEDGFLYIVDRARTW